MLGVATPSPALRMEGRINTSSAMGGLLPRASIYELGRCDVKGGNGSWQLDYEFFLAPASALLCVWRLWRTDARASASNWPLPSPQSVYISWTVLSNMPRRRGTPRRGSDWYARKEQRQRREELERAIVMATSLMRKKARAEEQALLSTIAESELGCSSMDAVKLEGSTEQLYPACIVEEDLTLEDLPPMEMMSDIGRLSSEDCKHIPKVEDDLPGCIVEEIPWPATEAAFEDGGATAKAGRSGEQSDARRRSPDEDGGGMHGRLLREEHLSLVFELRGHMADLEHRAYIMGQRLDVFLDAYSGAPARRKCPLCAQSFAIPAGSTRKTNDDDRSPTT
jgi:hypothetical protein